MTQVGSVYGEALYELCSAEGLDDQVLSQLTVLCDSFSQEPDFIRLLTSPSISKQERCQVLDSSFRDKVHPYVLNFMKILTEKGYMPQFSYCCEAYTQRHHSDHNILRVSAVTAVALTEKQTQALTEKLSGLTGKNILLSNRIDSGILGGVRLDYDGQRLDDTLSHRLDSIRDLLKNTVL